MPLVTQREKLLEAISHPEKVWDVIVVGGGATGLGTALDAASRGYQTLLLEQSDFAKGTSSRSTKLVHGGIRYLAQGNIALVKEALYERGLLLKNAPHLVKNETFVIPNYTWWGGLWYAAGLMLYDLLAGKLSFGRSKYISKKETIKRLPGIVQQGLYGGVIYHDGQFDDSRLAINLAQTCLEQGATVLNYFRMTRLIKENGKIKGIVAKDLESGRIYRLKCKAVINATGVFVDHLLQMDEPHIKPMVRVSQGIHLVFDKSFMPAADALMVPKTDDGRVLFALPWHDKLLVGTTDTPTDQHILEPVAQEEEIVFVLRNIGRYLTRPPERKDIRSVFAGLRPLAASEDGSDQTKEISRSHKLVVSASGLLTITGGKWTTYRRMAEDTIDKTIEIAGLHPKPCVTKNLLIHGHKKGTNFNDHLYIYGSDRDGLLALLEEDHDWAKKLHHSMNFAAVEVIWAVRHELARTVEDVLARRVRALFLDARIAIKMAPKVAALMAKELKKDKTWETKQVEDFKSVAEGFVVHPGIDGWARVKKINQ